VGYGFADDVDYRVARDTSKNVQNYPMARALIGGLLISTLLTLLVLPTYYKLGERLRERFARIGRAIRRGSRVPVALGRGTDGQTEGCDYG